MNANTPLIQPAFKNDDNDAELHHDFNQRVHVELGRQPWQDSPAAGVQRKRIELIGTEQPKLTTLVRFAPGSHFDEHSHDGGEELYILSGVFSDASGDYPAGTYVRNPPGTKHAPYTQQGCTLFVKLRQFQPGDQQQFAINIHDNQWEYSHHYNIRQLSLHQFGDEAVRLLRINAGGQIKPTLYPHGIEIFVIDGSLIDDCGYYAEWDWVRYPRGTQLSLSSHTGCLIYMREYLSDN